MALLSRKADYALLILSHLHQQSASGNARTISDQFGLSRPFTANILKELCRKGYVSSQRGVKGGYTLLPHTKSVNLADLLGSIDESLQLTVCTSNSDSEGCTLETVCPVRSPLEEIQRRIAQVFQDVSLEELFQSNLKPMPGTTSIKSLLVLGTPTKSACQMNPEHPCV
jgi:Rrf2 family transcriptional regulator, cysteine metabolism repressor